jgi:hypothetical protein
MTALDLAARIEQPRRCCDQLGGARDESYQRARQVAKTKAVLAAFSRHPLSDPDTCEQASDSLESLCESLVRLCALTDQAATNASALASLPMSSYSDNGATFAELNVAVDALLDETSAAQAQLTELRGIVADTRDAVDDMIRHAT